MISNKICNYAPYTILLYATVELSIMEHKSVETLYDEGRIIGQSAKHKSAIFFDEFVNFLLLV